MYVYLSVYLYIHIHARSLAILGTYVVSMYPTRHLRRGTYCVRQSVRVCVHARVITYVRTRAQSKSEGEREQTERAVGGKGRPRDRDSNLSADCQTKLTPRDVRSDVLTLDVTTGRRDRARAQLNMNNRSRGDNGTTIGRSALHLLSFSVRILFCTKAEQREKEDRESDVFATADRVIAGTFCRDSIRDTSRQRE